MDWLVFCYVKTFAAFFLLHFLNWIENLLFSLASSAEQTINAMYRLKCTAICSTKVTWKAHNFFFLVRIGTAAFAMHELPTISRIRSTCYTWRINEVDCVYICTFQLNSYLHTHGSLPQLHSATFFLQKPSATSCNVVNPPEGAPAHKGRPKMDTFLHVILKLV